jgi:hypothetical protein
MFSRERFFDKKLISEYYPRHGHENNKAGP